MFGHQNHDNNEANAPVADNPAANQPAADNSWQHPGVPLINDNPSPVPADDSGMADESVNPPADDHADHTNQNDQADQTEPETHVFAPNAADVHNPDSSDTDKADDDSAAAVDISDEPGSNDLIDIKQEALGKLSPLVGHLEQTPEEKFKTTMMMIQASDNQTLIPQAYDAAQQIEDEKTRAQALLDVINEINYFTQPKDKPE